MYEGYIPATPEKHREVWHEKVKIKLTDVFGLTDSEAQNVIEKLESMNLKEAYAYLEQEYDWYGARYLYEDSTYYKGTAEEINAYLDKKLEDKTIFLFITQENLLILRVCIWCFLQLLCWRFYFYKIQKSILMNCCIQSL